MVQNEKKERERSGEMLMRKREREERERVGGGGDGRKDGRPLESPHLRNGRVGLGVSVKYSYFQVFPALPWERKKWGKG